MLFWPYLYEPDSDKYVILFLQKFGEIGALPQEEFGRIGASVGGIGA